MNKVEQHTMRALLSRADPEKLWMREELPPSGLTWMPDLESLTKTESQLGELRRAFVKAQAFHLRCTFALGLMACIATGLSLYNFLLSSG